MKNTKNKYFDIMPIIAILLVLIIELFYIIWKSKFNINHLLGITSLTTIILFNILLFSNFIKKIKNIINEKMEELAKINKNVYGINQEIEEILKFNKKISNNNDEIKDAIKLIYKEICNKQYETDNSIQTISNINDKNEDIKLSVKSYLDNKFYELFNEFIVNSNKEAETIYNKLISELNVLNRMKDFTEKITQALTSTVDNINEIPKLFKAINVIESHVKETSKEFIENKFSKIIEELNIKNNTISELEEKLFKLNKENIYYKIKDKYERIIKLLRISYFDIGITEKTFEKLNNINELEDFKNKIDSIDFEEFIYSFLDKFDIENNEDKINEIESIIIPEYTLIKPQIGDPYDRDSHEVLETQKGKPRGLIYKVNSLGLKKDFKIYKYAKVSIGQGE